jgi:hypothetical protein
MKVHAVSWQGGSGAGRLVEYVHAQWRVHVGFGTTLCGARFPQPLRPTNVEFFMCMRMRLMYVYVNETCVCVFKGKEFCPHDHACILQPTQFTRNLSHLSTNLCVRSDIP